MAGISNVCEQAGDKRFREESGNLRIAPPGTR